MEATTQLKVVSYQAHLIQIRTQGGPIAFILSHSQLAPASMSQLKALT